MLNPSASRHDNASNLGLEDWEAPDVHNGRERGGVNIKMNLKNADAQFELNSRQMTGDQAVMQLAKDYSKACGANGANFSNDVVMQSYKHANSITKDWDNNRKGLLFSVFESSLRRANVDVESVKQLISKEAKVQTLKSEISSGANVVSISRVQDRIKSMPTMGQQQNEKLVVAEDDWVKQAKASVVTPQATPQSDKPGLFKRLFGGG